MVVRVCFVLGDRVQVTAFNIGCGRTGTHHATRLTVPDGSEYLAYGCRSYVSSYSRCVDNHVMISNAIPSPLLW